MRKTLMLFALLSCAACARAPAIVTIPPASCAKMIPPGWSQGIDATPIPDTKGLSDFQAVQAWASAYVGMSGQLDKANGRTQDAIGIMQRCEGLVNEARGK